MLESIKEVLKILKELKEKELLEEEIKKVKKIFETMNLFNINNPNYIMLYHGKRYLFNNEINILSEVDIVLKLDSKMIINFCNSFLIKKNMNVFVFGNDIEQSNLAKIINEF
jgi:predicted Zn-dependent peptidase